MIPKKYMDAYQSIKAPERLHDRVTSSPVSAASPPRKLPRRLIAAAAALAASLVIVTAALTALHKGSAGTGAYVAYNGQPVEASVAINMGRTVDITPFGIGSPVTGGIALEVHITDTTTVTVSDGTVTRVDENDIATDSGDLLTLCDDNDTHILHWLADFYMASENDPFSLVLADTHGSVTYTLTDSEGALTLTKESKN